MDSILVLEQCTKLFNLAKLLEGSLEFACLVLMCFVDSWLVPLWDHVGGSAGMRGFGAFWGRFGTKFLFMILKRYASS